MVDLLSGALKIKKGEMWLNTFTPELTYLLCCNTDVTSLMSGTAIKAVVGYLIYKGSTLTKEYIKGG